MMRIPVRMRQQIQAQLLFDEKGRLGFAAKFKKKSYHKGLNKQKMQVVLKAEDPLFEEVNEEYYIVAIMMWRHKMRKRIIKSEVNSRRKSYGKPRWCRKL